MNTPNQKYHTHKDKVFIKSPVILVPISDDISKFKLTNAVWKDDFKCQELNLNISCDQV